MLLHAQTFVVALIVVASAVYASWSLMPSALRRRLAGALLQWPLPTSCRGPLQRAAGTSSSGCGGCGGCVGAKPAGPEAPRPVVFHRRVGR